MYKDYVILESKKRRVRHISNPLVSLFVTCYFEDVAQRGSCGVDILLKINEDHYFKLRMKCGKWSKRNDHSDMQSQCHKFAMWFSRHIYIFVGAYNCDSHVFYNHYLNMPFFYPITSSGTNFSRKKIEGKVRTIPSLYNALQFPCIPQCLINEL